jgi:AraC family transcriptional regulator
MKPFANSFSAAGSPPSNKSRRVLARLETRFAKLEEVEYLAGACLPRHSQSFPFFACTVKGIHWSSNNYAGHVCHPGTVRFLPAGEPHENYFPTPSHCLLLKLEQPALDCARRYGSLPQNPGQLVSSSAGRFCRLLHSELHKKDGFSSLAVEGLVLDLLLTGALAPISPSSPIPPWLRRICDLLHEEPERRFSLAELAHSAGRHPVQVCRQFHQRFHCTIGEYLRRLRIGRAQTLLVSSELPVAEIALACGFSDQSQFTTAFRRLTSLPPARYRKQFAGSRVSRAFPHRE